MSQRTTVYRVEDAHGGGPYTAPDGAIDEMIKSHDRSKRHPLPWADGVGSEEWWSYGRASSRYVCGFGTTAALERWFRGWGSMLDDGGYIVAAYRVPSRRVRFGRRQLAFKRSGLHPVWTKPASEVIDIARRRVLR